MKSPEVSALNSLIETLKYLLSLYENKALRGIDILLASIISSGDWHFWCFSHLSMAFLLKRSHLSRAPLIMCEEFPSLLVCMIC